MKLLIALLSAMMLNACATYTTAPTCNNDDNDPAFCKRDIINHQNMRR